MYAQDAFTRLISRELLFASTEDVKTVALAIWYHGFVPQTKNLSEPEIRRSGYVIDKLMRFNCVQQPLKDELRKVILELQSLLCADLTGLKLPNQCCDPLAKKWMIDSDLKQHVRQLLEYQSRHYGRHFD